MIRRKKKTQQLDLFSNKSEKIEKIRNKLIAANDAYYNKNQSFLTDQEFDNLKDKLQELSPNDPFLSQVGAPVKVTEWKKARHKIPMTSLNKVNTVEEFKKWAKNIKANDFLIMEKMDGISIELIYKEGNLIDAITRGDGTIGESIVTNVSKMINVKKNINNFSGSLRGEIIFCKNNFIEVNEKLKTNKKKVFSNLRNAASGISKRYDGVFSEKLSVIFYDCSLYFKSEEEKLKYMENVLDVKTCFWKRLKTENLIEVFQDYENKNRENLKYEIDGMVVRVNCINLQKVLGMLGSNPYWSVAWKFKSLQKVAVLKNVKWNVGNSRRLTPIGEIEPVYIGGVKIMNVSLHNFENFRKLKLYKNCRVIIKRSNDVIPYLVGLAND